MTLPSGVICGVTSSDRFAFWKAIEVAPLEVAVWYGNCVPCSMMALVWSAVTTRGLDTTLPLPSDSSAEISRFSILDTLELNSEIAKAPGELLSFDVAGKLTKLPVLNSGFVAVAVEVVIPPVLVNE